MSNLFWVDTDSAGLTSIRFREPTLKNLGQIWNVVPKLRRQTLVKKGDQIFTLEITTGLCSIYSPISGKVVDFAERIFNETPEKINPSTVLLQLTGVNLNEM